MYTTPQDVVLIWDLENKSSISLKNDLLRNYLVLHKNNIDVERGRTI